MRARNRPGTTVTEARLVRRALFPPESIADGGFVVAGRASSAATVLTVRGADEGQQSRRLVVAATLRRVRSGPGRKCRPSMRRRTHHQSCACPQERRDRLASECGCGTRPLPDLRAHGDLPSDEIVSRGATMDFAPGVGENARTRFDRQALPEGKSASDAHPEVFFEPLKSEKEGRAR